MSSLPDSPAAREEALRAMRRPPSKDDFELSTEAHALLASLDSSVRPKDLAVQFPRIVNQTAKLWLRPAQMDKYLDGLLVDTRGNRKGFPPGVLMELTNLKEYYQTAAFPTTPGAWVGADSMRNR